MNGNDLAIGFGSEVLIVDTGAEGEVISISALGTYTIATPDGLHTARLDALALVNDPADIIGSPCCNCGQTITTLDCGTVVHVWSGSFLCNPSADYTTVAAYLAGDDRNDLDFIAFERLGRRLEAEQNGGTL